jgi:hypothetical protein
MKTYNVQCCVHTRVEASRLTRISEIILGDQQHQFQREYFRYELIQSVA